jgi:hypothetical protein
VCVEQAGLSEPSRRRQSDRHAIGGRALESIQLCTSVN